MTSTATAAAANGGQATAPETGKSQKIVSQVEVCPKALNHPKTLTLGTQNHPKT
jgi:hypothetical protein